jgi:hypothetical protein
MPAPTSYTWGVVPGADPPEPPPPPTVPEETDATVSSVVVVAHDMVQVFFNIPMLSNSAMALKTNYTVIPQGDGIPVNVDKVLVPKGTVVDYVQLVITDFSIGEEYLVVAENLTTPQGNPISEFNAAPFIGRRTKVDAMMDNMPAIYDLTPTSTLRMLFNAIGMMDDLIGGSRNDTLVGSIDPDA